MTGPDSTTAMVTALVRLRGALQEARLPLELPGAEEQRAARTEMVDEFEDYVIPRLMTLDAPLLAVVGGSTGAGKSTLVNASSAPVSPRPAPSCATHDGRSPVRHAPPRRRPGSARTACCPSSSGSTARPTTPPRCSSSRHR